MSGINILRGASSGSSPCSNRAMIMDTKINFSIIEIMETFDIFICSVSYVPGIAYVNIIAYRG